MFALLLMALGNFFGESASAMGKKAMANRLETIYGYGFLNIFWATVFLIIAAVLGASFHFSTGSLRSFIPRVVLEIIMAQLGAMAIHKADMSTFSFLRLLTIPLLLMLDIILGYSVKPIQMLGMVTIFATLVYLVGHNTIRRTGSKLVLTLALMAPINLSLYKYDITHYNSVAAEQTLVGLAIMAYFTIAAWYSSREHTWKYLSKTRTEFQSIATGFGSLLGSYAYTYVPASVAVTFSRSTELLFAIIFGNVVFHERKVGHKIIGLAVVVAALIMIALH